MDKKDNELYNLILRVAAESFDKNGYAATTTREISELAGISRGHLHYYFPKKDDILAQHFSFYEKKIHYFLTRTCQPIDDPYVFLAVVFRLHILNFCSGNFRNELLHLGCYDMNDYYKVIDNGLYQLLHSELKSRGASVPDDSLLFAIALITKLSTKLSYEKYQYEKVISMEEIWEQPVRHGLFALSLSPEEIDTVIDQAVERLLKIDLDAFLALADRRDYDRLEELF